MRHGWTFGAALQAFYYCVWSGSVTRVTIFVESDSTQVTLGTMATGLESRFSQKDSTRVNINDSGRESESFLQNLWLSPWSTSPVCLHARKLSFFPSVMIKIGANFLFRLSSRVILYFKYEVFRTITEGDLRPCFSLKGQQGTIYWHIIVA